MPSHVPPALVALPLCLLPYVILIPPGQGICGVWVGHPASGGVGAWVWWKAPENPAPDVRGMLWSQAGGEAYSWL